MIIGSIFQVVDPWSIHYGNLYVDYNNMKYKTTSHKYKLNFMWKTRVVDAIDEAFPIGNFKFWSFFDILIALNVDKIELLNKYTWIIYINFWIYVISALLLQI